MKKQLLKNKIEDAKIEFLINQNFDIEKLKDTAVISFYDDKRNVQ